MRSPAPIAGRAPSWRRPMAICSFRPTMRARSGRSFPSAAEVVRRKAGETRMHVEQVTYELAGKKYVGALVYDATVTRPRPALLMCPNWMGMRDQAIERAALLAQDRYVVFAADMYGEGIR